MGIEIFFVGLSIVRRNRIFHPKLNPLIRENHFSGVVSAVNLDTPYELNGDLGFQNTMEFITIFMGMYQIRGLGYVNTSVQFGG